MGEVKEKEQAHKEYKKAISEGHGAYLMDEETPVSNLVMMHGDDDDGDNGGDDDGGDNSGDGGDDDDDDNSGDDDGCDDG